MSRDALVVGINQYQYLPSLQAPAQDAEAIAQCLQAYGEFRVHRLPEVIQKHQPRIGQKTFVTLRQLESELINLFKPKGANVPHTALFYFSGHGMQRDAGIQDGYLAVSDSQPDVGFSGLSLFWLRRLLQESPVRQRIIILDCCHSGEFLNFLEADPGARSGTDRLFMAASREYEAAYESLESPYSVFTQAILEGLDPSHSSTGLITNYALTTWVSHALKGEVQQPLFESSGSEIILTRAQGGAIAKTSSPSAEICPYRGLECFEESHAEYFFGRSELTDQLLDQLRSGRFVAVVGASGSGKSSLVRAGLISELRKGQKFSGSDRWRIRLLTPTEHPLKSLAGVFVDPDLTELERAEQLRRAEAFLDSGGTGLAQLVRASLVTPSATGVGPRPHLLLIIDQFEEIFTLCNGPTAEQERQQFFNCLIDAIQSADRYLSVVIVLRADFFGKCSLYSNLAQQVEQNLIMVTPMTYEQIKSTIIDPAQKAKLVCEPNLIYTMLLDVVGAPGELPLLQYTLSELWKHRQTDPDTQVSSLTLDAYTELGGIRGTLQKRATEIFNSLLPEEQIIAKRVFLALTQLGEGTEDTRRRVLKSELVSPSFPLYLIEQTLEKLVAAKLVVTSQDRGTWHRPDSYQASHVLPVVSPEPMVSNPTHDGLSSQPDEFLGGPTLTQSVVPKIEIQVMKSGDHTQETIDVVHETLIRNWSLLRGWLEENREMLRRQRLIERASQEWNNAGQPSGAEYLLRGSRLVDAEDFLDHHPKELSLLAQHYTAISRMESQRARKESRLLQLAVPSMLLVALIVTLNQYRNAVQTQAEKEYQLQVATSRERAAIAQSILQEPNGDPLTALLISRLAAVQGGHTYEAQASLRASLQDLRLQFTLSGHTQAVSQMVFSPDHDTMATASSDGTIRLWPLDDQTLYTVPTDASTIISWNDSNSDNSGDADITALSFDSTGHQIAAIAQGESAVSIWSVKSGALIQRLQADFPLSFLQVSPIDDRVIAATDQTIWIWEAGTGQVKARLPQPGPIRHIELSSDGQMLLAASNDGTVRVWQLPNPSAQTQFADTPAFVLNHSQAVGSATFSPDHRWIATIGIDQQVRIWRADNGELLTVLQGDSGQSQTGDRPTLPPEPSPLPESDDPEFMNPDSHARVAVQPFSIRFSPNGQTLAVMTPNQAVQVWQHDTQAQWTPSPIGDTELNPNDLPLYAMAFSPDSRFLVTGNHHLSYDHSNAAYIWDLHTGKRLADLRGHKHAIVSSTFSPNGSYVATADTTGNIWVWAADEGGELPMIRSSHSPVRWAAFEAGSPPLSPSTPDANNLTMITITADGRLNHWDLMSDAASAYVSKAVQSQVAGRSAPPTGMVSSPRPLSSLSIQRIWKHLSQFKQQLRPHRLATASQPPNSRDSTDNQPLGESLQASESSAATVSSIDEWAIAGDTTLTAVALGHQDSLIAAATHQGTIEIRQLDPSTKLLRQIQLPLSDASASTPSVQFLTFSPSNQTLLSISDDSKLRLWDVQSGDLLQTLPSDAKQMQHAAFSPNGRWIVSASLDETAQVWDVSSGKLMLTLPHQASVMSAQFSPDSRRIVTASLDGTARIWDASTGEIRVVLSGHRGGVLDARFSPDGRSLATASQDGTLRLWDAATGTEQVQLRPTQSSEQSEAILKSFFSPDGHYVAALTEQGEIHLWTATWEMLLKLSSDRSLRDLTPEECIRYLRLAPNNCP
ncbi:MAG: caspase family protein [Elainellaceae cyanobacterium]